MRCKPLLMLAAGLLLAAPGYKSRAQDGVAVDQKSAEVAQKYLKRFDKDGDGEVSREEAKKFRFGDLMEADADGSGTLSLIEMARWTAGRRSEVAANNQNPDAPRGNRSQSPEPAAEPPKENPATPDGPPKPAGGEAGTAGQPAAESSSNSTPAGQPTAEKGAPAPAKEGEAAKPAEAPGKPAAPPQVQASRQSGRSFAGKKSYRIRTARERLPTGLPNWFLEKDADADGQVMMFEWTVTWTDAKAEEFNGHDRNGDGVITAKEAQSSR